MSSARPSYSSNLCERPDIRGRFAASATTGAIQQTARVLPWRSDKGGLSRFSLRKQPLWLWPNLLSLDAPLIAVLWLNLFAVSGQIRVPPLVSLTLGLVVWLIYLADRLTDGWHASPLAALSARHQFYRMYRLPMLYLLLGVFGLTCWVALKLDRDTIAFGMVMMLVLAGYFGVVHSRKPVGQSHFSKEAIVAVVFGVGTFFPAWIHTRRPTAAMAIALVLFVLICWLNVLLIEFTEWMVLRGGKSQVPHRSTVATGRHLLPVGMGIAVVASCFCVGGSDKSLMLAISLSATALAALGFYWRKFSIDAVRVLADLTLLTPALAFLLLHR